MNHSDEEADFLRALAAAPADVGLRLIFADWLEERDDLGGAFLRLRPQMVGLASDDPEYLRLREREHALLAACLGRWLVIAGSPVWGLLGGAICPPIPLWLVERNIDSWQRSVRFYKPIEGENPATHAPLRELVEQLAASETAMLFRSGQSMWTFILSTAAEHGLQNDDAYLAIDYQRSGTFEFHYYHSKMKYGAEVSKCMPSELQPHVTDLMARLWCDTRDRTIPPP